MVPALTLARLAAAGLLLVAQARSIETLPAPPTFTVDVQRDRVTLSLRPPDGDKVRWVIMDLPDSRSWAKPTKRADVEKRGVRATFRHPHAAYAFVVRLYDGTQYRIANGRVEVTPPPAARPF